MGVVVADRAVHLRQRPHRDDAFARTDQPRQHVRDLLAERGRARGLAVRARQHRHVGQRMRERAQPVVHLVQRGQQHLVARGLQHQRVAGVVDVLAGAGEVHELGRALQFRLAAEALLDPVLDRLDVVVGAALDRLDRGGVGLGEVARERLQPRARRRRQRREFGEAGLGQRDEPFDLDLHARAHQAVFAEQRAQRGELAGVAPVERRQRGEGGQFHGGGRRGGRRPGSDGARRDDSRRARPRTRRVCHAGAGRRRPVRSPTPCAEVNPRSPTQNAIAAAPRPAGVGGPCNV